MGQEHAAIEEIEHFEIPLPDGCRLAARIWRPVDAVDHPVPAILEYLPYRKNDFTQARDVTMQPHLAAHGYAVIRLDLRGTGDSEGLMRDEYLPQELQDGADAIAWIAAQDWCDGNVGMIGISWGGFNGLQIAALQPPALKTIITLCSTDDRYADDIHYQGGCLLGAQPSWASTMFARNTLAPDPANVGDRWEDMWRERLEGSGLWLKNWLEHQTRDDFWKHGSVTEDISKIRIPVYAVSGWADGYYRTVFRLMETLQGPRKGLVGPWAHLYPHIGKPGPAIDFLTEELRWWDQWLKGIDTGIMEEPQLRLFLQDSAPPRDHYVERSGRWVVEPSWPSPSVERRDMFLGSDGSLRADPAATGDLTHQSPYWLGQAAGNWCGFGAPEDPAREQRREDEGSLCFDTEPMAEALDLAGDPVLHLRVAVDRPVAQLAARLCIVDGEGRSTRVSYGVLNLTHRDGHEDPQPLEPGRFYDVRIDMKHLAQQVAQGYRLRLAISTQYWPMVWPSPEPVTATLRTGDCKLVLPVRHGSPADADVAAFDPAPEPPELEVEVLQPGENWVRPGEDPESGECAIRSAQGKGVVRHVAADLVITDQTYEEFTILPDGPNSARATIRSTIGLARGDWRTRAETWTELTSDTEDFRVRATMRVWNGDALIAEKDWDERIPRAFV